MQKIFHSKESYKQIAEILSEIRSRKFLLVCGKNSFDDLNIKLFIDEECPNYVRFSDFSPNPSYAQVCRGVDEFNSNHCDAIVAIGGGSTMDVAKCIKLFCQMNPVENYLKQEFLDTAIPLIAVPTTAGSGSESTRYAVIYYKDEKQSVTHVSIVPNYAILDSSLLKTLPLYQKKCTMLDALCQGIESWWSINSTDESKVYSKIAVETIMQNWRKYIFEDDELAAEQIMLAANYAGRAIDITQTTAPHAFSYKLTSLYGISHGHAVAICLPLIWEFMQNQMYKCIDSRGTKYLEDVFNQIAHAMGIDCSIEAIKFFGQMLNVLELQLPVSKNREDDVELLSSSVNPIRLKNNPIYIKDFDIRCIYRKCISSIPE